MLKFHQFDLRQDPQKRCQNRRTDKSVQRMLKGSLESFSTLYHSVQFSNKTNPNLLDYRVIVKTNEPLREERSEAIF